MVLHSSCCYRPGTSHWHFSPTRSPLCSPYPTLAPTVWALLGCCVILLKRKCSQDTCLLELPVVAVISEAKPKASRVQLARPCGTWALMLLSRISYAPCLPRCSLLFDRHSPASGPLHLLLVQNAPLHTFTGSLLASFRSFVKGIISKGFLLVILSKTSILSISFLSLCCSPVALITR